MTFAPTQIEWYGQQQNVTVKYGSLSNTMAVGDMRIQRKLVDLYRDYCLFELSQISADGLKHTNMVLQLEVMSRRYYLN